MAYNSDGYIMIDFTEVDFRRTNQTIDGLYKRCVEVIGTNKFILVINANGRTPLPATCSFTNNQYVIDTCIYMFAISSNDNLFIRRNDVPASDIIDDDSISVDKTWSSNKIDTELDAKADTSALADYQPKLTAGTNITIDENNVISSTGGAVIDDTLIVNNKVWSSLNTVEKLAPIDAVVGNPATFKTSLALPIVACNVTFTATQEGTGDPSPTNVRNIVGVDDITLSVNGNDIFIELDDTRYGATVDVVNGVVHVTHAIIDISDISWIYKTEFTNPYFQRDILGRKNGTPITIPIYKYDGFKGATSAGTMPNYNCGVHQTSNPIYIRDDRYTSTEDFIAAMAGIPLMYELAEPFDIQLTPTQIETIVGNNTISSDTGSLTVSYKALPIDLL